MTYPPPGDTPRSENPPESNAQEVLQNAQCENVKLTLTRTSDHIRPSKRNPNLNRSTVVTSGAFSLRGNLWMSVSRRCLHAPVLRRLAACRRRICI